MSSSLLEQETFIEVVLPRPLDGPLTYKLMSHHSENYLVGRWVLVPLGREKVLGCIWGVRSSTQISKTKLRSVLAVLQWIPSMPIPLMGLLSTISSYYYVTLGEALTLAMPRWISQPAYMVNLSYNSVINDQPSLSLLDHSTANTPPNSLVIQALATINKLCPLIKTQIPFYISQKEWNLWLSQKAIVKLKVPHQSDVLFPSWQLVEPPKEDIIKSRYVRNLLHILQTAKMISHQELMAEFPTDKSLQVKKALRYLLDRNSVTLSMSLLTDKDPTPVRCLEQCKDRQQVTLTEEQNRVIEVLQSRTDFKVSLLHGVTGSGKTEVYLEVIESVLKQGQQALVLVPEIGLTPQTIDRFRQRLDYPIYAWHSQLSTKERVETWQSLSKSNPCVLIGARSALFAPMNALGVIIIDEAHDSSYKQGDGVRYHARDMAIMRGSLENCRVILGTATPSLESMHNAFCGKYQLLELKDRPNGALMPTVKVVDLKRSRTVSSEATAITHLLATAIEQRLKNGEQTILFLNRRGFSQSIRCVSCGYIFQCPQCQLTLPWHLASGQFQCHHCDFKIAAPSHCPQCSSNTLAPIGRGTERIESQLKSLFSTAKIVRLDQDSAVSSCELHALMNSDQVDILIGTQMVTKGHDFQRVTLVGVIDADVGIDLPDFRANERSYQLLSQVAGRAGRGQLSGEVIVQTYRPNEERLLAAITHNYQRFFLHEMTLREVVGYPPFGHLATIRIQGQPVQSLFDALDRLKQALNLCTLKYRGPILAPLNISKGEQRWIVLLSSPQRSHLHEQLRHLFRIVKTIKKNGIYCIIDMDPMDFF